MNDERLRQAIELYDRFTHEGLDRRDFFARMTLIAGSAAAATCLIAATPPTPALYLGRFPAARLRSGDGERGAADPEREPEDFDRKLARQSKVANPGGRGDDDELRHDPGPLGCPPPELEAPRPLLHLDDLAILVHIQVRAPKVGQWRVCPLLDLRKKKK